MNLQTINTHPLSAYGGSTFSCACGRTHDIVTADITAGAGTIGELCGAVGRIVPTGSAVLLLTDRALFDRSLHLAERQLRHGGYLVKREFLSECHETFEGLDDVTVPEDIRLIVGAGGGSAADCAKYLGGKHGLPVFLVVTTPAASSCLLPQAVRRSGEFYRSVDVPPPRGVLCDYTMVADAPDSLVAGGFGELVSRLLALFDWRFAAAVRGEGYCRHVAEQAYWAADSAVHALDGAYRGDKRIPAVLAELSLRLSAVMQSYGAHRLFGGGDGALNACLKMLLRHEGRTAKTDGENAFVLSAVLCKIYRQVLDEGDFGFVPPPDNNLRMEKLSEYLGVPREAAAEWLVPYPKTEAFKLQRYRVREYRDELSDILAETDETMTTAYRIFKRLYRDDGYSLSHYLAEDDVRVCLALAPDVGGEFSLLTQMKIAGLLDKYL